MKLDFTSFEFFLLSANIASFNLTIGTYVLASVSVPASSCMMMMPFKFFPPTSDRKSSEPVVLSVQITQVAIPIVKLKEA